MPVSLGISTGGGGGLISQSLAIVVEGGLVSSTLLPLVVLPVMYSLVRRRPALKDGPSLPATDAAKRGERTRLHPSGGEPAGRGVRAAGQAASCRIAASSPGRSNIGQCQPSSSR